MAWFIIGCQHMVLAGARDRAALASPIYNSFYNLIRYHLGTVCLGSLVVTIVMIIRIILRSLASNRYGRFIVDCCFRRIEFFVRYLTKNAFIQTAIHRQAFFKSGKRGVQLLLSNVINVIALNSVGNFIHGVASLLIILVTVGLGFLMYDDSVKYFGAPIFVGGFISYMMSYCVFSVFEMATDTFFLCYCEEHMSINLNQFVEDLKRIVPKKQNN